MMYKTLNNIKGNNMEYTLLANPIYRIGEDIGVVNMITNEVIGKDNEVIELEIYGQKIKKEFEWFLNLAKFRIQLPPQCYDRLKDITFRKTGFTLSKHYNMLVQTKEPIIYTYEGIDYAIVLGFDFNAYQIVGIDRKGNLLDVYGGSIIKVPSNKDITFKDYRRYNFGGRGNVNTYYVHRLIISAWIWNDDPVKKYQANHKDLDKLNNTVDNLEWITPKNNLKHLIENGDSAKLGNIQCKSREKKTGKIFVYPSIADMVEKLNITKRSVYEFNTMRLGFLFNGHEIRVDSDDRDWFYKNATDREIPRTATRVYRLYNNEEVLETFFSTIEINNYFKYYGFRDYKNLANYAKKLNSNYTLECIYLNSKQQNNIYQARNIITDEIIESESMEYLAKQTNIQSASIGRRIRAKNDTKPLGDWVFRIKVSKPWGKIDVNYRPNTNSRPIKVINTISNEETVYASIAEAVRTLKTTKRTIKKKINTSDLLLSIYRVEDI